MQGLASHELSPIVIGLLETRFTMSHLIELFFKIIISVSIVVVILHLSLLLLGVQSQVSGNVSLVPFV
jgi:hypothetical protein